MACRSCEEARRAVLNAGKAILRGDGRQAISEAKTAIEKVGEKVSSSQNRIRRLTSR